MISMCIFVIGGVVLGLYTVDLLEWREALRADTRPSFYYTALMFLQVALYVGYGLAKIGAVMWAVAP